MATLAPKPPLAPPHRQLLIKLLAIVALSFAFGFALVPLYDALCQATGLNGKTATMRQGGLGTATGAPGSPLSRIDYSRTLTVEFTGTVMPGLPWDMQAETARLDLHPGELHQVLFRVHNRSDRAIVGQAIPSVSPGSAALHFEKLECFCFAQQTLAPGETREMPVAFIVKPEIDRDIRTLTLAYAFFNTTESQAKDRGRP
jgi:cytochrome c oxidase assembly protein subunit 11